MKRGSKSAVWRQSTPRRWNSAMRSRIVAGLPIRRLAKPSSCPVESRDRRHEHHHWAPRVHTSARASCAGQRIYRPRGLSSPVRCALTRATESSSGGVGSAARRNERECDNQNDGHTHRVLRSLSISGGGGGASTNLDASPSAGALGARTLVLEESHDEGIVRGLGRRETRPTGARLSECLAARLSRHRKDTAMLQITSRHPRRTVLELALTVFGPYLRRPASWAL